MPSASTMKDPYLKPVILGGLFITLLSIVFVPGIFLWAAIGGYITVRLARKITKESPTLFDVLLLGAFPGVIGGALLDVITAFSFKSFENQRSIISVLEHNWPKEIPYPNFNEILPSVFLMSYLFIILTSVFFSTIGAYISIFIIKKTNQIKD